MITQPISILPINKQPDEIKIVFVEAVLMPNGELINNGNSFGWLTPKEESPKKGVPIKYVYEKTDVIARYGDQE